LTIIDMKHALVKAGVVAVKQNCNVFLTCDSGIRDRAAAIKDRFELIVQKPSEFVASQGW